MYTVHKQQLIGWTGFRQQINSIIYIFIYIRARVCFSAKQLC